ncbi:MAG: 50S ribosomal protein L21 [Candidatus Shapirobacteria bacterium]|nr:50S ribosomal protein L21 [Candidatus Shapirobacteria bacterium]
MKKFAVVEIAGHQYWICENDELAVNNLKDKAGNKIKLEKVLLVANSKIEIGQPYLKGRVVEAQVVEHLKGDKVRVATYKAKSRYRRVKGFRSQLTKLKITKIN